MSPPNTKHRVGVGLSLQKLAKSRISKYDKRVVLEKQRQLKLRRKSEYNKLKRRLEADDAALLQSRIPENIQDDPYDDLVGLSKPAEQQGQQRTIKKLKQQQQPEQPEQQEQPEGQIASEPDSSPAASDDEADAASPRGRDVLQHEQRHKRMKHKPHQQQGQQLPGQRKLQHGQRQEQGERQEQQQQQASKRKTRKQQQQKPPSKLEQRAQQQREAQIKERLQAQQAREEAQARAEAAEKQRRQQKKQFFKKTRTGQPVMKFRIDKILQQLQSEQR